MNDTGVIDRFFEVFTRYIDSGFGLLGGEVAFIASTLVVIDITLAALFWAWGPSDDVVARLVKKTLFVGFFAFLIGNSNALANIVFQSFSGLGLKASGSTMSNADFLRPGVLAQAGIDAGRPMLESASQMAGFPGFFENFVQIAILMVAFIVVVLAFFVLAIQLFVTLIEFKLTTLAGFVLIPFGLFGKTAFLAERVLGNVVASGVKVLVMAVIVGIGSTLFDTFVSDLGGAQPTLDQVLSMMLGALSLLALGIFGPGIATGLVSGAPQLGAGAAVGTGLAVGGVAMAGAAGARLAVGGAAGLAGRTGSAISATRRPSGGGGSPSGSAPQAPVSGAPPTGGRGGGAASAGSGAVKTPPSSSGDPGSAKGPAAPGETSVGPAASVPAAEAAGASPSAGPDAASSERPAWARDMARRQAIGHGVQAALHAVRSGDRGGGSTSVSVSEDRT